MAGKKRPMATDEVGCARQPAGEGRRLSAGTLKQEVFTRSGTDGLASHLEGGGRRADIDALTALLAALLHRDFTPPNAIMVDIRGR